MMGYRQGRIDNLIMKKLLLVIVMTVFSGALLAEDAPPVANIKISPDWGKMQCASQPGKGLKIVWNGVVDSRNEKVVGSLKKGKEETDVLLAKPVDEVIGEAIKTVLKNCGFELQDKDGSGIKMSAELTEFFAGAQKGFFTGQTDAKGSLTLHFVKGGSSYAFTLGATKSDKRLRKKNIEQLEQVLTGLLEAIVAQIGESPSLFEELRKMEG